MDNYGQVNKGQLWVQTVAALPTWSSADIGRILLLTTTGDLYYSNNTGWSKVGGAGFESGVKMYFYMNAAPTGWVIDATVSDALIGVKGGTSHYNIAGGNVAGTWTQPTHTHTGTTADHVLTIAEIPSHYHELCDQAYQFAGTHARSWTNSPSERFDNNTYKHRHTLLVVVLAIVMLLQA